MIGSLKRVREGSIYGSPLKASFEGALGLASRCFRVVPFGGLNGSWDLQWLLGPRKSEQSLWASTS